MENAREILRKNKNYGHEKNCQNSNQNPELDPVANVSKNQMEQSALEKEINQNLDPLQPCVNPVSKKQMGRSALMEIEINPNSANIFLDSLQPRVNPVSNNKKEGNITGQEDKNTSEKVSGTRKNLTVKLNEIVINIVPEITSEGTSEILTNEDSTIRSQNSENEHELFITTEKEEEINEKHIGRRIVNVSYFCKQLLDLCNHGPLGCSASDIILTGEKQHGLISKFTFKCKMCNLNFVTNNDCCEENYLNLNTCAVAGTVATGCGQSQLEELFSAMNIPILTEPVYNSNHSLVSKHWERVALNQMQEAGKREKEIAIAEGNVTDDGYGVVDVIVDGCWSKRSYKKNYSALSGAAAIIGKNTGEILFLGVKNKYCQICAMAEKENKEAKEHLCFKNYNGPSTGMESQILVEGFKNSITQHGLVYGRLILDGDSSTYLHAYIRIELITSFFEGV